MPIDSGIPLSVRAPAINTPFESLGSMMQLQHQQQQMRASQSLEEERRQQIAKQQKQEADEEAYRQTITATAALPPDQIRSAIAQHAPQHLAAFDKEAADLADKAAVMKEHKATAAKSEQDYIGKAADAMRQAQGDPVVMNFVLNRTVEHFPEWAPHADELRQVALTQGKEGFLKTLDALTPADITKQRAEAANATAELPGKQAQSAIQTQVAAGTVGGLTPEQQAQNANAATTAATARGQLGVAQAREGREQKQFNATYGSLQGQAGTENPLAKAIAEYRSPPVSPRSMASGPGKALMEDVIRMNPDYDASQFPTRQKTRIAFTSGPQSQTLNSLNTAVSHLDQFVDVAKALKNGNFQPGNQAYNWLKTTFGDTAPTNFEGIKQIMSGELASAFKKSGATDQEIAGVERAIASKNSTDQLVDYATKIAIPALGSKAATFNEQYHGVMGAKDPWSAIYPDAQRVLKKYGQDPTAPKMGGSGASASGAAPSAAGPKEGDTKPLNDSGAEATFKHGAWIRTK
jgi:hypothetical protein